MANTSQMEQLQASGMDHKTAEAISNAIARAIKDAKPAASTGSIGWLGVGTLLASVGMMMGVVIWQSDTIRSGLRAEIGSVRAEIGSLRDGFSAEIGSVRDGFSAEIGSVRDDFRAEIGGVRSDMRAEFGSVRAEMGSIRAEMGEMQEKIGSMQEKIGRMQEEISKVRTELDEIRSAISSLGEQMIRFEMLIQDRLPSAP